MITPIGLDRVLVLVSMSVCLPIASLLSKQWCCYTFSSKSLIKVEPRIASYRRSLSLLILVLDPNLISCPEYLKRFSDIVTGNCKWLSQKYRANILLVSFGFFPSFFFYFCSPFWLDVLSVSYTENIINQCTREMIQWLSQCVNVYCLTVPTCRRPLLFFSLLSLHTYKDHR